MKARDLAFAVVGAAAMAVHGVARGTSDLDILALATECLDPTTWRALPAGIEARIHRGDADDPLAGVVRFKVDDQGPVDLIVGKSAWQRAIPARARIHEVEGVGVPVATVSDLILLKLYAGGPQDAWDIEQLLEADPDRNVLQAGVEAELTALPAECRRFWSRIRSG